MIRGRGVKATVQGKTVLVGNEALLRVSDNSGEPQRRHRGGSRAGITAALPGWIGPIQVAMIHIGPDDLVFLNSVKLLRIRLPA
jgi:hypothetical protein